MSDCSTEAMKPKAKTCGMCAHGINRLVSCWELDPQGSHHAQNEPACHKFAERKQDGMCSCNKSRGYDELFQRYQQLEQVTKSLYEEYSRINKDMCQVVGFGMMFSSYPAPGGYRRMLDELGVSLDG